MVALNLHGLLGEPTILLPRDGHVRVHIPRLSIDVPIWPNTIFYSIIFASKELHLSKEARLENLPVNKLTKFGKVKVVCWK